MILSIFAGAALAAARAICLVYCGVSLTASAAMSAAASGTSPQMKLTTDTQTAGFLATDTRNTSIAVSALSTFFAFATNELAMYGISAPGAFEKAALIASLSTAALAETIDPPIIATATPILIRMFFFMILLLKSFTANGFGSFCIDSDSVNSKKQTFYFFFQPKNS